VLAVPPSLIEEAFGDEDPRHGHRSAASELALHFLSRIAAAPADPLEIDEVGMILLGRLASDLGRGHAQGASRSEAARQAVLRVRLALAEEPTARWRLTTLAAVAGCSPYHLARTYRAITGLAIHQHLLSLRLALALERLAEGDRDLARLATDLGFTHHSHFTARFHSVFGVTPSDAHTMLSEPHSADLRKILAAHEDVAA
jgi:AraC-like DNA-binding protein